MATTIRNASAYRRADQVTATAEVQLDGRADWIPTVATCWWSHLLQLFTAQNANTPAQKRTVARTYLGQLLKATAEGMVDTALDVSGGDISIP